MNTSLSIPTTSTAGLLGRIYRHVANQPTDGNVSLLSGQMGYALLEAYTQDYTGETDNGRILERVSNSLAAIQNGELTHSFGSGMAGVAWGFLHLFNHGLLPADGMDVQDIVSDLDKPLFELSMEQLQKGNYDYLYGGLSAGLYYLERRHSPAITRFVERIIAGLSDLAIRFPNGDIAWAFTDFGRRPASEPVLYNLGLSHGAAGLVGILSLFHERGYARPRCSELIQGTLQWLWNHRNRSGKAVFPNFIGDDRENQDSRLGWCYGDLGIAHTFWLGGQTLNNALWLSIAQQTMLQAAQRRLPQESRIQDAGICHGSAGAAHLFRRFAQRLPHPLLTETADYWMQQTARFATSPTDENVFLVFNHEAGHYEPNLGLLDGECSVGLVLLSELGIPAFWDRFLLLS